VQNDIGGGGQGEGVEALLDVEYIKARRWRATLTAL
jgi:hypothetical protein